MHLSADDLRLLDDPSEYLGSAETLRQPSAAIRERELTWRSPGPIRFAPTTGSRATADKPLLVLSHSLGLDHGMWDPQMPGLLSRFRVLRYDTRGHGATDAPAGDYTMEALGRDALALLDGLGLASVAWCGASLGGMIGQWLAVHAPERCRPSCSPTRRRAWRIHPPWRRGARPCSTTD